jgi:hypothetical protein
MTVEMPPRIARLPRDKHGRPTPWFVAWIDGQPDFRVIRAGGIEEATRFDRCWVCGQRRGSYSAFVIGPMCAVNRISAEPPAHRECAIYSARACPFLATPNMHRRERGLPEDFVDPPGTMITRNPGVALVWVTRKFERFTVDDGFLFDVGAPLETLWFADGRKATREEVLASIESGLPLLRGEAEREGDEAMRHLEAQTTTALALVPL